MRFLEIAYVRMSPKVMIIGWNGDNSFGETRLYKDNNGIFHIDSEDESEEFFVQLFTELHRWTREQEDRLLNRLLDDKKGGHNAEEEKGNSTG